MNRRSFMKASTSVAALATQVPYAYSASSRVSQVRSERRSTLPETVEPPVRPVRSAGLNDSRRFLDQATMGARPGEAATLTGSFSDWINTQVSMPYTEFDHDKAYAWGLRNITAANHGARVGLFARWCNEDAQLRFRVTHVLQQIVVGGSQNGHGQLDAMLWWNKLASHAFTNYREVLRAAVTHRHMGAFLNNLGGDASKGKAPSQNLARELLQLFSLGIDKLGRDGSVVKDSMGNAVPAFRQADVDALARLLSGWNLPFANQAAGLDGTPSDGTMMIQRTLAYDGPAVTFLGARFEQVASPTTFDVLSRMDRCLDIIIAQPSTAAYVSKQFIQKMVTDSPSAGYISRVVSAFENNGSGVRGDMKALIRAVLLDPEARGNSKPASFGRTQEWALSLTKGMRYAQMETLYDAYSERPDFAWAWAPLRGNPPINVMGEMGQVPLTPESVFNDYPYEYQVNGVEAPAAAMWRAPQVLANVGRTLSFSGDLGQALASTAKDATGRWQLSDLIAQYNTVWAATTGSAAEKQAAAVTALVELVFADLNQGRPMTRLARSQTIEFIHLDCADRPTKEKLAWLVNFVRCLPESAVVV